MNEFNSLYQFITLAQKNRKYPVNTAHGRRAALKLFETVLHPDELESLDLIEERMKEIYLSLISKHKDTYSIKSLNTYKGRFLKIIQDYKKYGTNHQAFANWEIRARRYKDRKPVDKDKNVSHSSLPFHKPVHNITISIRGEQHCVIEISSKPTKEDISIITKIINSLAS